MWFATPTFQSIRSNGPKTSLWPLTTSAQYTPPRTNVKLEMTIYAIRNCYFPIETRSNGPKSCVEFGRAHTRKEGEGAKYSNTCSWKLLGRPHLLGDHRRRTHRKRDEIIEFYFIFLRFFFPPSPPPLLLLLPGCPDCAPSLKPGDFQVSPLLACSFLPSSVAPPAPSFGCC